MTTDNKHRTLLFFFLLVSFIALNAQETPLILFKQRMLHKKHDDGIEQVDSFSKLHLMVAGNIYQTEKHAAYAYDATTRKYDFKSEFKYVQPLLNLGDISIANLKTSFSNNVKNMFSSPDEFALALKYSGINAVMQANVHTANFTKANLKRTSDLLDDYDVHHTGVFTDNIQRNGNYPLIIDKKGFRIAILNYTNLTSRPTVSRDFIINEIDKTIIERDMHLARAYKADFIIAYFDWGANLQDLPSYAQQELAQYVFQMGANLIVGTHPNTPMRIDLMNYSYNSELREGIIAYSLGNLIGSNEELRNRNGYIIDMEIQKNNFTHETHVSDWGVVPVYTYYDTTSIHGKTKVFSVPCSNVESGDIFPNIPYIEKRRAVNSAYEVRKLLGSTADEIQYNLNELIVNNVMESIDITNASLNNKYHPKREEEVKPTDAPVLPVVATGSNNPPSLAILYDSAVENKTLTTSSRKKEKEKQNTYLGAKKDVQGILSFDAPANENVSGDSTGESSSTKNKNNSSAANIAKVNSSLAEKQTAAAEEINTKAKSKNEIKGSNPNKKDQSVNTNYHTTGDTYDLNDSTHTAKNKKSTATPAKERVSQQGIEISVAETNNVTTGVAAVTESEMGMVKAKELKLVVDTFYRIQFYALRTFIPLDTNYYTHLKGYEVRQEDGLFKYMLGKYKNFEECEQYWKSQIQPRYKQSFIVKFVNGKRVLQ